MGGIVLNGNVDRPHRTAAKPKGGSSGVIVAQRFIKSPIDKRYTVDLWRSRQLHPKPRIAVENTGVDLTSDLWELLNLVAFERARTKGGRVQYRRYLPK